MISKWFLASFRTLPFVFLYGDQEPRSWGGGVQTPPPPPPSRQWKIQRPSRARVNPRPAGPLDFPRPAGGGCLNTPPPPVYLGSCASLEQNGKRRSKAREKSFRNHFGHFLAQVKIEVTRGQNSKIFQNDFWTIKSLILKVEQRFLYHRVCLVKARRTMYNLTLKGQGQNLTSGQVRARSLGDPSRSNYTSFDAPCGDKRNDSNPTSLSYLVLKLLAKKCWWPRVTSMTFRRVIDEKFHLEYQ